MKPVEFQTLKTSDKATIDALKELARTGTHGAHQFRFVYRGEGTLELGVGSIDQDERLARLLSSEARVFRVLELRCASKRCVRVTRQDEGQQHFHDGVSISPGPPNEDKDDAGFALLVGDAQRVLGEASLANVAAIFGPDVQKHFEAREQALNRLERVADRMMVEIAETGKNLEQEYLEKARSLDAQQEEKSAALEREHEQRLAALDERQRQLDEHKKQLDDREAKHVRRQTYKELKDKFRAWSKEFKLSTGTSHKRAIVHAFSWLLLIVFGTVLGALVWTSIAKPPSDTPALIASLSTKVVFTLLFVSTAAFYIKWNTQWFQRHANEEFRLKRMELDLDRASWFVELAFQWKDENQEVVPDVLVDRLTQYLFAGDIEDQPVEHPGDLLGTHLVRLNATKEGAELELDRRSKGLGRRRRKS
jgi:hypothetical protein